MNKTKPREFVTVVTSMSLKRIINFSDKLFIKFNSHVISSSKDVFMDSSEK